MQNCGILVLKKSITKFGLGNISRSDFTWKSGRKKYLQTFPRPIKSYTVKVNNFGAAVSEILRNRQRVTDPVVCLVSKLF